MNREQISKLEDKVNEVVSNEEIIDDVSYVQAHKLIKEYFDLPISNLEKKDVMTEVLLLLNEANNWGYYDERYRQWTFNKLF